MNLLSIFKRRKREEKAMQDYQRVPIGLNFNGVSLYPRDGGNTYIEKGYNMNAAVYTIVSENAKKLSQVPCYHYRIKKQERKTWAEYLDLTAKDYSPEALLEAKRMRKKAMEDVVVDSDLSKLLKRPNRYQSGANFIEQLYGHKQLTGEGNIWLNKGGFEAGKPVELLIIPKPNLLLKGGVDAWDVAGYQLQINGRTWDLVKEDVVMWKYPNYNFSASTLEHLRGLAPLSSALLVLQANNEGQERRLIMNKNQGVAGLAFRKDAHQAPTPAQAQETRRQFDDIVNAKERAGSIALMSGDWNYLQFGLDAGQLKLLEQMNLDFETLCRVLHTPPGIFMSGLTYENAKEEKRNWVHNNIAVAACSLRDELNAKLIPAFNLDMERDVIDFSIMDLPEMTVDMGKLIDSLMKADFYTQNEKRVKCGDEPMVGPEWEAAYMATGKQTLSQTYEGIDGGLDQEVSKLGDI